LEREGIFSPFGLSQLSESEISIFGGGKRDGSKDKGQKELNQEVKDAHFCTGCGACINLCPYQASYRDQVVMLHSCDLKEGDATPFARARPRTWKTSRNVSSTQRT